MIEFIKWWFYLTLLGWVAFPISFYLFNTFRTKGYAFSKIIGLLIWGYIFWIGNTFGIFGNTRLGAFFSIIFLLLISIAVVIKKISLPQIALWIRDNFSIVLFYELLFLLAALFMVMMRGANPEIIGTEKPMELAFINGILKSSSFPPNDPWLSSYSISYYYFGYLIIAAIVKLLGTNSGIAFNLALIFWFGLIAIGSSDIVFNLLHQKGIHKLGSVSKKKIKTLMILSLFAPLFVLIISNGEGLLELLHSLGIFWKIDQSGVGGVSQFWQWIDIQELTSPPAMPLDWDVRRMGGTWWWRASRVLQDYTMLGDPREIIDEFPFFSFFLGDLHPHVLAMPFVLLNIGLAKMLLVRGKKYLNNAQIDIVSFWKEPLNWFLSLALGSLIFFNTWDFPIYFGIVSIVIIVSIYDNKMAFRELIMQAGKILIPLGIVCIFLYIPFLMSFSSQAGGLLPSLVFQSRSIHLLTMFFPFVLIISSDLILRQFSQYPKKQFIKWIFITFGFYLLGMLISISIPILIDTVPEMLRNQSFYSIYGAVSAKEIIGETITRIVRDPFDIIALIVLIGSSLTLIFIKKNKQNTEFEMELFNSSDIFLGILLLISALLIIFPEIFYLRDQFGWRMNTIFKFYFQAWILLAICAAYALPQFRKNISGKVKIFLSIIAILVGLVYPFYGIKEKINGISNQGITLDGNEYLVLSNPDEKEAVNFLNQLPEGIVLEAVGGSYSGFARISKLTGFPTVLGWPGHEVQWRGGGEELGSRESDIKEIYSSGDIRNTLLLLEKYDISYIYIGDIERKTYQIYEEKFTTSMPLIFENGSVVIYKYVSGNIYE